jgi:hypothetical protein
VVVPLQPGIQTELTAAMSGSAGAFLMTPGIVKVPPADDEFTLGQELANAAVAYRGPKADHCSTERCPQNPMAKWNKVILWFASAFVIAIAAFPTYSGVAARLLVPAGASDSGPSQVRLATLQVSIPSMDCRSMRSGH